MATRLTHQSKQHSRNLQIHSHAGKKIWWHRGHSWCKEWFLVPCSVYDNLPTFPVVQWTSHGGKVKDTLEFWITIYKMYTYSASLMSAFWNLLKLPRFMQFSPRLEDPKGHMHEYDPFLWSKQVEPSSHKSSLFPQLVTPERWESVGLDCDWIIKERNHETEFNKSGTRL